MGRIIRFPQRVCQSGKPAHLRKGKDDPKATDSKKRKRGGDAFGKEPGGDRLNAITDSNKSSKKKKGDKKSKKRDLSEVTCYNCQKKGHYKNVCTNFKKEGKASDR